MKELILALFVIGGISGVWFIKLSLDMFFEDAEKELKELIK